MDTTPSKKVFPGNLSWIDPEKLIGSNPSDLDKFFLVLALIYNDLKGIVFLGNLIFDNYVVPPSAEITAHAGERAGLLNQRYKLAASLIHEFFNFLEENKGVLKNPKFKILLARLPERPRLDWLIVERVALGEKSSKSATPFQYSLLMIRNNVGFHYYQSMKGLARAFRAFFTGDGKSAQQDKAYYSLGKRMEDTRFYYADAAAQEYIFEQTGSAESDDMKDKLRGLDTHTTELTKVINQMNQSIYALMAEYLKSKK